MSFKRKLITIMIIPSIVIGISACSDSETDSVQRVDGSGGLSADDIAARAQSQPNVEEVQIAEDQAQIESPLGNDRAYVATEELNLDSNDPKALMSGVAAQIANFDINQPDPVASAHDRLMPFMTPVGVETRPEWPSIPKSDFEIWRNSDARAESRSWETEEPLPEPESADVAYGSYMAQYDVIGRGVTRSETWSIFMTARNIDGGWQIDSVYVR